MRSVPTDLEQNKQQSGVIILLKMPKAKNNLNRASFAEKPFISRHLKVKQFARHVWSEYLLSSPAVIKSIS